MIVIPYKPELEQPIIEALYYREGRYTTALIAKAVGCRWGEASLVLQRLNATGWVDCRRFCWAVIR